MKVGCGHEVQKQMVRYGVDQNSVWILVMSLSGFVRCATRFARLFDDYIPSFSLISTPLSYCILDLFSPPFLVFVTSADIILCRMPLPVSLQSSLHKRRRRPLLPRRFEGRRAQRLPSPCHELF